MHTVSAMKRLGAIPDLSKAGKPVNGLFRLLTCRDLWLTAYEKISRNKGSMTPGADGQTFDGISLEKINTIIANVMEGRYQPTPVRRVYIPKANGKLRPLGIPTATDRLVQEVVRLILDTVYEPIFSDHSHGFRAGRSCHTALTHVEKVWHGVKWFVEVDVVGYFDNIDHTTLMTLLARKVDDKRFLRLINSFLKAGYLEDWQRYPTYSGTPQGGIISPLLANIYLHELDCFMENWIETHSKGNTRRRNLNWSRLHKRITAINQKIRDINEAPLPGDATDAGVWDAEIAMLEALRDQLLVERSQHSIGDPMDPNYRRYRYVRYADDFLIGVIGSKADAQEVMDAVRDFLRSLKLEVSEAKSAIRHASDGVIFLGYDIHTYLIRRTRHVRDSIGRNYTKRSGEKVTLNVPMDKMRKFCKSRGYGDLDSMRATHRKDLLNSSEYEIVAQFNAEFRGFATYYALSTQVKARLDKLQCVITASLLKTIANKRRTRVSRVSAQMRRPDGDRYGTSYDVTGKPRSIRVWRLKHLKRPNPEQAQWDVVYPRYNLAWLRTDIVDRTFAQGCALCGSVGPRIEIHHVRKLVEHQGNALKWLRAAKTRKRIPLCSSCHSDLHKGRLPDLRGLMNLEVESRVR